MTKNNKSSSLLPKGFEDLLPPDAEVEFRAIGALMKTFASFGYERVKPPMAEFEDSLLAPGPGEAVADQAFRMMDPVSEKMLALRSDITAQIARIALSRLADAPRPLRLTYANDVIRTKASQQRTLRQFCQAGCEIIGGGDVDSVIEIAVVALKGLSGIGVKTVTLDFSVPRIADVIFDAAGGGERDALRAQLSGNADKVLDRLSALTLDDAAKAQITDLKAVLDGVRDAADALSFDGVAFTIDPLETKGFEYHHGVTFTLFANGLNGEIGRGGRYLLDQGGATAAAGFTLYMDTVRLAMPEADTKKVKEVSAETSWDEIQKLQDDGYIVKRGL